MPGGLDKFPVIGREYESPPNGGPELLAGECFRTTSKAVLAVLAARGKVSLLEYLQLRVRYFADGAVLGTREYVDGMFRALRGRWGPNRTECARPMRGVATDPCVLRDHRKQVFG